MTNPVPHEQVPLNEYRALRQSFFLGWGCLPAGAFWRRIVGLWLGSAVLVAPIAAVSFPWPRHGLELILWSGLGACLVGSLPVLHLWLGWRYVLQRLESASIVYEETGWYDGQEWTKSAVELTQDRLLVSYEVSPIVRRISRTLLAFLGGGGAIALLIWGLPNAS
jgi:hypothetical protein